MGCKRNFVEDLLSSAINVVKKFISAPYRLAFILYLVILGEHVQSLASDFLMKLCYLKDISYKC